MTARSERGRCRRAMMDGAPAAVVVFPSVRTELGSDKKMLIITQQYESGRKGRPALPWLPGGAPLGRRERRTSRRWPADGPPMGSRWPGDGPPMARAHSPFGSCPHLRVACCVAPPITWARTTIPIGSSIIPRPHRLPARLSPHPPTPYQVGWWLGGDLISTRTASGMRPAPTFLLQPFSAQRCQIVYFIFLVWIESNQFIWFCCFVFGIFDRDDLWPGIGTTLARCDEAFCYGNEDASATQRRPFQLHVLSRDEMSRSGTRLKRTRKRENDDEGKRGGGG